MYPALGLVIMIGIALIFYRAAEFENLRMPFLWGGGSVLLYLGGLYYLNLNLFGLLGLQFLLMIAMGAVVWWKRRY